MSELTTATSIASGLASDMSDLSAALQRAVVEIRSGGGCGAGIVWGTSGLIVTNAHCAPPNVDLEVRSRDDPLVDGRVIAYSRHNDLALIEAQVTGPLFELRDVDSLEAGELVFALGHPFGMRDSLAMGILHGVARHRRTGEPTFIVADVRLAPGNSGGPLVDAAGRLVGVNSMVVGGLGAAIPAVTVQRFVERARASRAA